MSSPGIALSVARLVSKLVARRIFNFHLCAHVSLIQQNIHFKLQKASVYNETIYIVRHNVQSDTSMRLLSRGCIALLMTFLLT